MVSETLLGWVLLIEGVFLISALTLFFGHGLWLWWYRQRSRPLLARARLVLVAALGETPAQSTDLQWLQTLPSRLQIRLFFEMAPNLSGAQHQRLTELARELGLVARAETYCRSRQWWRRLQGVRLLSLFGGGEEVVSPLFHDRDVVVRAQAAEWAADHPSPVVIDMLLFLLGDPERFCCFTAQESLLRIGGPVIEPLARYLADHSQPQWVEAALKVAVGLADPRLLPPALCLCRDASPRVRVLAASLLGMLGGGQGIEALMKMLDDPLPEVRAAAAQALGKLGHWPAAATLATLLQDHAWQVRREAGLALRALGAPGALFLRRSLAHVDSFTVDMARQILDLPEPAGRTRTS